MKILAIESSCDDTAVAVLQEREVLSSVIASQVESHIVFGGVVPDNIEDLTSLPGVGRKTANLVCGDIYKKPAVVTDTHFIRICNRLGFVNTTNPLAVEKEMRKLLPPEKSNDFCHRIVLFGRDICSARKAKCDICPMNENCKKVGIK